LLSQSPAVQYQLLNSKHVYKYEGDFSDISDGEILTATQLFEASFKPDTLDQHVGLPLFSDISDYELLMSLTMKIINHQ